MMFYHVFTAERMKVFKRALVWVCISLLLALLVFDLTFSYSFSMSPIDQGDGELRIPQEIQEQAREDAARQSTLPWSLVGTFGQIYQIGWLVVFIVVGSVVAQEYTWRSLNLWVSQGISRFLLLAAKFATLIVILLMVVIIPVMINGGISAFFTYQTQGSLNLGIVNYAYLALGIGASICSLLPYAAFAYFLAVLSKSTFVPIGGGVAFFFLENVLASKQLPLTQYLPCSLVNGLSSLYASIPKESLEPVLNPNLSMAMNAPSMELLSPEWAVLGLILWTLSLLGLALFIFQRQDLTE
jgi:ABC-type transport system involved in multi-copper enzyme maturation permease subunit